MSSSLDESQYSQIKKRFAFKQSVLIEEYNNFIHKEQSKYADEDHMRHLRRHKKTYGIIPDTKSPQYL